MINIITDSSCDLQVLQPLPEQCAYIRVPLKILVGEKEFVDDDALDPQAMLKEVYAYPGKTGSACPSPDDWAAHFRQAEESYALTISGNLSGSYNSAVIARQMVLEENPEKKIFVLDSLTAGSEMTLIIRRLRDLVAQGLPFEEICTEIVRYRDSLGTLFILNSMDNLVKNGRVNRVVGFTAKILNIKVIGKASDHGTIEMLHKCRGELRNYETSVAEMLNMGYKGGKVTLSHAANLNGCHMIRDLICRHYPQAQIDILPLRGLCSYYAEQSGIILGFEL